MVGRRPAAAADDADAVALDELAQRRRQRLGLLGEDRLAVGALQGQAGVGDAVDRQRAVLAEEADRVAHVLGAGRAVEPDHVDVERGSASSAPRGCRCRAASCRRWGGARRWPESAACGRPSANASRAPKIAALTSRMSCAVSTMIRSAPPWTRPVACSAKTSTSLPKEMSPRVGSVDAGRNPVGPIEPATKRSSPAALRAISRRLGVDLERVLAQPPLLELQPRPLEGVGLDHLGARLQHRGVDALDHVGPVQHQRLMALALEPAVIGLGQLELLQGRAHAAVEDDDALLGRGYEIALGHESREGKGSPRSLAQLVVGWVRAG